MATIEFLGLWEKLSNPDFKPIKFERFKNEAGNYGQSPIKGESSEFRVQNKNRLPENIIGTVSQ
jgi:hypothetical protein